MPQGLIRIVMPLLMVLAFLLYVLSVGMDGETPENSEPASIQSSDPNAAPE